MADASFRLTPVARERSHALEELGLEPGGYLLLTIHREANTEPERLARIVEGIGRLEEPVVFPVHPRTRAALDAARLELGHRDPSQPPLGYLDLTALASQARVILTDSGGLQKEAYWHGVSVRDVASLDGVGRHRRGGSERARRRRSRPTRQGGRGGPNAPGAPTAVRRRARRDEDRGSALYA